MEGVKTMVVSPSTAPLVAVDEKITRVMNVDDLPKELQFILRKETKKVAPTLVRDRRKTNLVCPICTEYLYVPASQNVSIIIDCGHGIHSGCKKWLLKDAHLVAKATSKPLVEPKCPICSGVIRWKK